MIYASTMSRHLPLLLVTLGFCSRGCFAAQQACDSLVPEYCSLPYPNNYFTAPASDTATGLRLNLSAETFPRNTLQVPLDPGKWNDFGN